jgi:hypothetical protein
VEKLKKKGTMLEVRDDNWMMIDTANNKVEDGIA